MSRRKGPRTKVVFALLFQQILQILAYYISKLSRFYHIFFTFLPFLKLVHPSQFFGERKWLYYTFTINMNIYIYVKFHFRGSMYCLQCTLHWENVTLKFENSNKKKNSVCWVCKSIGVYSYTEDHGSCEFTIYKNC